MTTVGLDDIGTSTTLESNKSLILTQLQPYANDRHVRLWRRRRVPGGLSCALKRCFAMEATGAKQVAGRCIPLLP